MSKPKHRGQGKTKGSSDARKGGSSPYRGGKRLDDKDEAILSRMLKDYADKEEESDKDATVNAVLDAMQRRGLVVSRADSRRGSRSHRGGSREDRSEEEEEPHEDDCETGSSQDMSSRKRRNTSKIRRLHEKLDVLTDEVESLRRSNTRLQDEGALIKAGVTESITAALTPAESGGTPDPGAQTFTLDQFTAMLAKAKVDALLKTPDKLPDPKPSKAKVK